MEKVIHPFDPAFPQYELAKKQMTGACGLLTFVIRAQTEQEVIIFCESLKHILIAVSWGGYESLIIPKCASLKPGEFDSGNLEHRMLRLYVGLEDADYLVKDLEQAFGKMLP